MIYDPSTFVDRSSAYGIAMVRGWFMHFPFTCRVINKAPEAGSGVTDSMWKHVDGVRYYSSGGVANSYFNEDASPIKELPLTIVCRLNPQTAMAGWAYMIDNASTHKIGIQLTATEIRAVYRAGGATPNSDDYVQLVGPTIQLLSWYTLVFSVWGNDSQNCKLWYMKDGDSGPTTVTSAGSFTTTFPTVTRERIADAIDAHLQYALLYNLAFGDDLGERIVKNPSLVYQSLENDMYHEPAYPETTFPGDTVIGGVDLDGGMQ